MKLQLTKKTALILVIFLAVSLNFSIFCYAYPETFKPQAPTLSRDFSAYYTGTYRLFHSPTKIYMDGVQPGDYPINPLTQTFKYTPSALLLFSPIQLFNYQNALNAFDIVQFLSVMAMAFFVYKLVKDKSLFLAVPVSLIILLQPILITPSIGYDWANFMHYRILSLNAQTFSPCYYAGYLLANAHILQTSLLVGALYFGFSKKPWLSALLFAFGLFDPRAALFALPLLIWYNKHALRKFLGFTSIFVVFTNLPFFFYQGIGMTFLQTEVRGSVVSQMYLYDWIPLYAVGALTVMEAFVAILNRKNTSVLDQKTTTFA